MTQRVRMGERRREQRRRCGLRVVGEHRLSSFIYCPRCHYCGLYFHWDWTFGDKRRAFPRFRAWRRAHEVCDWLGYARKTARGRR